MGTHNEECKHRGPVYDHRRKAGNRGDVVKHVALLAVLDTLMVQGGLHELAYAETFAGFPESVLRPGGGWETGIGALPRHGTPDNPHLERWYARWVRGGACCGAIYPGSTRIALDCGVYRHRPVRLWLWETWPEACAQLIRRYRNQRIYCRPASPQDLRLCASDLLFVDPPGLRSATQPDWPDWAQLSAQFQAHPNQALLAWLPLTGTAEAPGAARALGLATTTLHWARVAGLPGCRLIHRLPPGPRAAMHRALEALVIWARWQGPVIERALG